MKRPPKHLRCGVCGKWADLRTRGTFEFQGRRYHARCVVNRPATARRMSPAETWAVFGVAWPCPPQR